MYDDGGFEGAKCVDVAGTDKPGELCTVTDPINGIDSCVEGAICWSVEDGVGTCVALCRGSYEAPVCDPPIACTGGRLLTLCIPNCDPLLQDCPHPGHGCYPIDDGFTCAPDDSGDAGQANDPCEFINSCRARWRCAWATTRNCSPRSPTLVHSRVAGSSPSTMKRAHSLLSSVLRTSSLLPVSAARW
jgi:hypothetical protein